MENKKKWHTRIIIAILFLIISINTGTASSTSNSLDLVSMTTSTDTYQNKDGSYTKILYSGVKNIFEDIKWKRVEDARSLKGKGFNIIYIEKDSELIIKVIDFNYTSITYKAQVKRSKIGKNIPIKIYQEDPTFDLFEWIIKNPDKKLKWKDKVIKKSEKTHRFNNETEEFIETIPFGLDYYLEFGENSTVIILQDANTENLDDTLTELQDDPNLNHGAETTIRTDSTRDWRVYIKFDLLQIPSSSIINEAYLYLFPPTVDDLTTVKAYHVFNYTWTEGNGTPTNCINSADCNGGIIHNRQPCGANFDNSQQCNLTAEYSLSTPGTGRWHIYNITKMIRAEYSGGDNNISIVLRDTSGGSFKQVYYNSKEHANISTRPYLNVTYSPATSTDLEILEIIPIQVVRDVDMVLGKTGLVRINVKNNGPADANATVTVTFEGNNLTTFNDTNRKFILINQNASFDFRFKPTQIGNKNFSAEVVVS